MEVIDVVERTPELPAGSAVANADAQSLLRHVLLCGASEMSEVLGALQAGVRADLYTQQRKPTNDLDAASRGEPSPVYLFRVRLSFIRRMVD